MKECHDHDFPRLDFSSLARVFRRLRRKRCDFDQNNVGLRDEVGCEKLRRELQGCYFLGLEAARCNYFPRHPFDLLRTEDMQRMSRAPKASYVQEGEIFELKSAKGEVGQVEKCFRCVMDKKTGLLEWSEKNYVASVLDFKHNKVFRANRRNPIGHEGYNLDYQTEITELGKTLFCNLECRASYLNVKQEKRFKARDSLLSKQFEEDAGGDSFTLGGVRLELNVTNPDTTDKFTEVNVRVLEAQVLRSTNDQAKDVYAELYLCDEAGERANHAIVFRTRAIERPRMFSVDRSESTRNRIQRGPNEEKRNAQRKSQGYRGLAAYWNEAFDLGRGKEYQVENLCLRVNLRRETSYLEDRDIGHAIIALWREVNIRHEKLPPTWFPIQVREISCDCQGSAIVSLYCLFPRLLSLEK